MGNQALHQIVRLGVGVELLVESAVDGKLCHEGFLEGLEVQSFALVHKQRNRIQHHVAEVDFNLVAADGVAPAGVHGFALIVHHVVVFEKTLTDAEVVLFHLLLRTLDGLRQHLALQNLVLFHAKLVYHGGNTFASEETHQLVFQRDEEYAGTRVALTSGTAAELTVHAAAVVTLGTHNGQTACGLDLRGKLDIGTTACHIGGDGNSAALAGLSHDFSFAGVLLGVEHVVLDAAHTEHAAEEFGSFHVGGTHQNRAACVAQLNDTLDDGCVLGLLGLIDKVVLVVTDHRTVRGDDHYVELVDAPEFTRLRFCGTGHTGQLVVHAEVVLEGDGGEGLGCRLDLHVFLGLDGLVQSVAPAAAFHHTAGLLVHDLDLAVHDDVVHILLELGVGLEQLVHGVDAFALEGEVLHEGILGLLALRKRHFAVLDVGNLAAYVGDNEEVVVAHALGKHRVAFVGHVHRVELLVDHEVERVGDDRHLLFVVLDIVVLRFLENHLHSRFAEELDEGLILRKALVGAEQQLSAFGLVAFGDLLLGLVEHLVHQSALLLVEFLNIGPVFHELRVRLRFGGGTADDERSTGVVDENRVNLVHDGVVMLALHEVFLGGGHVVAEVVETELVVGTESDVAVICPAALVGVGFVLVDAIHAESVELVERAHPFAVSFGQVVVHGNHVHTLACKSVQEHRKGCHKGFTFTGGHFGDFSLMQGDTADELHVVVHHVPLEHVSACLPGIVPDGLVAVDGHEVVGDGEFAVEIVGRNRHVAFGKTPGSGLHDCECLRKNFREALFYGFVLVFHEFVGLGGESFFLIYRNVSVEFLANLGCAVLERLFDTAHVFAQSSAAGAELVVRQFVSFLVFTEYLVQRRLDRTIVAVGLGAEYFS